MARKISVEIVGDASSLQRTFQRSGASAKVFERDISKAGRGAAAASLSFHGLGRALSFASGYFLASGGIIYALKAATKAGIEHQAQTAQLAAAVTHAGVSYKAYGSQIQETLRKQRDLAGFSENETDASFTKLLRTTKSISAATRDNALAMEIARGAGIDLNSASNIVNKTLAGQTTGLRRLGVELPKGVSGYRALQIAGAKYAGSVTAFTNTAAGAQARLTNALHDTEITVGTALLPTITKYSTELANWLDKSENQKKIQHDVNVVLRDAKTVVSTLVPIVKGAADAVGGFSNAIKILLGLKVAKTLFEWRAATVAFGASAGASGAAGSVAALSAAVSRLAAIGAVSIAIRFPGLAAGLAGLASVPGAIAAATAAAVLASSGSGANVAAIPAKGRASFVAGLASHGDIPKSVLGQAAKAGGIDPSTPAGNALKNPKVVAFLYAWAAQHGLLPQTAGGAGAEAAAKAAAGRARSAVAATTASTGGTSSAAAPLDRLSQIQDQVAQARLAVAQKQKGSTAKLVAALKAEIDYDAKYAAIQEKLAKQGGKNAKKHSQTAQALLSSETADLNEISSLATKNANTRTAALSKADKALFGSFDVKAKQAVLSGKDPVPVLKAEERAVRARMAVEGKTLALRQQLVKVEGQIAGATKKANAAFTVPLGLQLQAAKAGATVGTNDDLAAARSIKAYAQKVLRSGKATMQTQIDAWNEIASQNATIASILANQGKHTMHSVVESSAQFVKGLHFASLADKQAAEARFAQAQAHGGRVPNVIGAAGQPISLNGDVILDGQKVGSLITGRQQRDARHAAVQTRGPQAGRNARVH